MIVGISSKIVLLARCRSGFRLPNCHMHCIGRCREKLLQEGALTEDNLLDSSVKVLNLIRECNVTLRWLMLHTSKLGPSAENVKKCRQLRDLVSNETKTRHGHIFQLLLNTAQFEHKLITMYKKMIHRRSRQWEKCREKARGKMTDLIKLLETEKSQKASR